MVSLCINFLSQTVQQQVPKRAGEEVQAPKAPARKKLQAVTARLQLDVAQRGCT